MTDVRLGHVHFEVSDLERSIAFYEVTLGLEVRERVSRFAFLAWEDTHHDLALQEVPEGEQATPPERTDGPTVGLYHVAFEFDDADALGRAYRRLTEADVTVTPVDHGISKALYIDDPDGNGVELYVDTRSSPDERWGGRSVPFDPETL